MTRALCFAAVVALATGAVIVGWRAFVEEQNRGGAFEPSRNLATKPGKSGRRAPSENDVIPAQSRTSHKQSAFVRLASAMRIRDLAAATSWIEGQVSAPWATGAIGGVVREHAIRWAETSPAEALSWLDSMRGLTDAFGDETYASLISRWAGRDPEGAGQWLRDRAQHFGFDRMAEKYSQAVAAIDPAGAREWAMAIGDESRQRETLFAIARRKLRSPQGAEELLAAGFDPALVADAIDPRWVSGGSVVRIGSSYPRAVTDPTAEELDLANVKSLVRRPHEENLAIIQTEFELATLRQLQIGSSGEEAGDLGELILQLDAAQNELETLRQALRQAEEAEDSQFELRLGRSLLEPGLKLMP